MIISFAWTTPALLAGKKTVTRRDWTDEHAEKFRVGQLVDAWDKGPRTGKGKKVAVIRIARDPYIERTDYLKPGEWDREGFEFMANHSDEGRATALKIWHDWGARPVNLYVVEFVLEQVV